MVGVVMSRNAASLVAASLVPLSRQLLTWHVILILMLSHSRVFDYRYDMTTLTFSDKPSVTLSRYDFIFILTCYAIKMLLNRIIRIIVCCTSQV